MQVGMKNNFNIPHCNDKLPLYLSQCGGSVNCRNLFGLACLKWHFYYQLKCAMNAMLSYHKSTLFSFILCSRFNSCNLSFEWLKEKLQIRHLSENLKRCKQNNCVGFLFVTWVIICLSYVCKIRKFARGTSYVLLSIFNIIDPRCNDWVWLQTKGENPTGMVNTEWWSHP